MGNLVRVNKLQAVEVQINAAIEMLFREMSPVPIHTVTAAAFRVMRDLAKNAPIPPRSLDLKNRIKPGKEGNFWTNINGAANFFKHADQDADGTYQFSPEANDLLIFWTISIYRELKGHDALSSEMKCFLNWFMPQWRDLYIEDDETKKLLDAASKAFQIDSIPRDIRLKAGLHALNIAKTEDEHGRRWPNLKVPTSSL